MQENVIVFLKSDRRAINPHYLGGRQTLYSGKPIVGRTYLPAKNNMGFATPIQEYTRANHCIFMLKVLHLYEVELHSQCLIKLHAAALWNILEEFSELKWAGRLAQVLVQTLLSVAED